MIGTTLTLNDVVFGDVWFCAGQSNMEMMMKSIQNAEEEMRKSAEYNIRFTSMSNVAKKVEKENLQYIKVNMIDERVKSRNLYLDLDHQVSVPN